MSTPYQPGRDPRGGVPPSAILKELGRPLPAPDLTGPVMNRLGLNRVSSRAARRRRIGRGMARLALVAVAVGASALCVQWHELGAKAPRPSAPTIPSAIRHDLEHHGRTIDRAIRSIRGLSPWRPALSPPRSVPVPPERDETTEELPDQQARNASQWV
jgi:hypothetical protein